MERDPWFRAFFVLGAIALAIYLGGQLWDLARHFSDIIIVFFLAWLVAFILTPLAAYLQRSYSLPRGLAVSIVYLGLFVNLGIVVVLVVPLAVEQLVQLGQRFPMIVATVQSWLVDAQRQLEARGIPIDLPTFYRSSDITTQIGSLTSGIVANAISLVGGIASVLFSTTVVLVLSFYLVLDGERLLVKLNEFVPAGRRAEGQFFLDSISRTFGGFLRGTLVVSLAYTIGNALIMTIAGLSYVLLASLLAGVLMIIPIFGSALAMVLPVLLVAIQGDVTKVVFVVVGLLVLQVIVFNMLSPKVMGQSVGLHPLLVFLALLVGIKQAGFVGAIFGVPVAGVVYAMLLFLFQRQSSASVATGAKPAMPVVEPTLVRLKSGRFGARRSVGWLWQFVSRAAQLGQDAWAAARSWLDTALARANHRGGD